MSGEENTQQKKTKNPSLKRKQGGDKVSQIYQENISSTLIVIPSDERTINWWQIGTIKATTFPYKRRINTRLQLKSFSILETIGVTTSLFVF
jgi:hypothetical protein